jgi:hypothetical protein
MNIPSELLNLQPLMLRAIIKGELDPQLYEWIDLPKQIIPERLSIYRTSSKMSVLSALKKIFKATLVLLGEGVFEDVASEFLSRQQCASPDISEVGERFAPYLKERGWVSDLAAFEWAWHQTFHGPNHPLPETQRLQHAIETYQESLPLQCTPGVVLLYSPYALPELWQAVMAKSEVSVLPEGDYYFVFSQQQSKVKVQWVSRPMYEALQCLHMPGTLTEWIERYQAQVKQPFAAEWVTALFTSGLIQLGDV